MTPYQFAYNNPLLYNDVLGDSSGYNLYNFPHPDNRHTWISPGSGNHWSDGARYEDWSANGGSDTYRAGSAAGMTDIGGVLYHIGGDGIRSEWTQSSSGHFGYYDREAYWDGHEAIYHEFWVEAPQQNDNTIPPDRWENTKSAMAVGLTLSIADGPIPVGEMLGAAIIIGALAWDIVRPNPVMQARIPKNRLPDKGPPNGKLERRNPDTGDLLQERWYDENGFPKLDKDYGHDHGAGDPHIHEWSFPSPLAPNPVRGPGIPLN
jgi:hypothetical protein